MLTHGDWHDFTVSILECKEIMKIYRDHLYGLNIIISYHHIILYYKTDKTIVTQKVLITQSSNIVYCNQHTRNLYVQIFKPFQTLLPVKIEGFVFLFFVRGS